MPPSKEDHRPSQAYLNLRRPSWTPSLPEPARDTRDRDSLFMSSSYSQRRSRKRRVDDISSFSPFDPTATPSSFTFSFTSPSAQQTLFHRKTNPLPDTPVAERPRKRILSADAFQENATMAFEPSSPEEGSNLRRSLQIDMKSLVGDAVGNMSISPSSRDVVLAARRGLFILDLESPLEVPRFLPQGGTWDVADVQWNPHPQRDHYIVSTSSEKLLIWNLLFTGKTSIQHILKSHYRAITDINWHTTECDTVASTGIDSWIYAWDLREPRRPIFGLSAFRSGGTQVKWNRKDGNILASSHSNEVLIWDRRKGSLPVSRITAHNAKIYGIDWSQSVRNELVTCSLDKTIKTWDMNDTTDDQGILEPRSVIRTNYPVWRALNLPFGHGLLSLPQRGETILEMYASNNSELPVEVFEGHSDVVKEFVWRKGGPDEFQLITWSKDRTLRFWPLDNETLQKVGHWPDPSRGRSRLTKIRDQTISYRNPPENKELTPALSNPFGNRPILAEVRAPLPPVPQKNVPNMVMQPHIGSAARGVGTGTGNGNGSGSGSGSGSMNVNVNTMPPPMTGGSGTSSSFMLLPHSSGMIMGSVNTSSQPNANAKTIRPSLGGTMSRGNVGGKSVARMDAFTWLSNVKVGVGSRSRRGSSSGAASVADSHGNGKGSTPQSRMSSVSRVPSALNLDSQIQQNQTQALIKPLERMLQQQQEEEEEEELEDEQIETRGRLGDQLSEEGGGGGESRSKSRSRAADDKGKEGEGGQSLQDEITSVLTKLVASKIRLEKHDLTKKRTCTLGLQGPWGERSSVFIRVTFTFPRDYPQALHPEGTPTVEVERNPLISMNDRVYMLKRLKTIREKKRPCLEACLKFLLFGDDAEGADGRPSLIDSSEDEEEQESNSKNMTSMGTVGKGKKGKGVTVSLLRNNKNLAEPRTSQGTFGPNGEFICFFRAPPRVVRSVTRVVSSSGPHPFRSRTGTLNEEIDEQNQGTRQREGQLDDSNSNHHHHHHHQQHTKIIQSPALLSDAIRRLTLASVDRTYIPDPRKQKNDELARVMTSLLTRSSSSHSQSRQHQQSLRHSGSHLKIQGKLGSGSGLGSGLGDAEIEYGDVDGRSRSQSRSRQRKFALNVPSSLVQVKRSIVMMWNVNAFGAPDSMVAIGYIFEFDKGSGGVTENGNGNGSLNGENGSGSGSGGIGLKEVCQVNARVAEEWGRWDHVRVFKTLEVIVGTMNVEGKWPDSECERLAMKMFMKLYEEFAKEKDLQILAMMAILILQTPYAIITVPTPPPRTRKPTINILPSSIRSRKTSGFDYFSITQAINQQQQPASPVWGRIPSPNAQTLQAPALSSSNSSKGSWSNLFSTGRQFVQDTFNPGLSTPLEIANVHSAHTHSTQLDKQSQYSTGSGSGSGSDRTKVLDSPPINISIAQALNLSPPVGVGGGVAMGMGRKRKDSALTLGLSGNMGLGMGVTSRSWNDSRGGLISAHGGGVTSAAAGTSNSGGTGQGGSGPGGISGVSFASGTGSGSSGKRDRAPPLRWTNSGQSGMSTVSVGEKQVVVFEAPEEESVRDTKPKLVIPESFVDQLTVHVHVYAELLFRWQLYEKRIDLLKVMNKRNHIRMENKGAQHNIGLVQICSHCGSVLVDKSPECPACHVPRTMALCTICRLPVKGLSRNCLQCHHVSHVSCWNGLEIPICPTGCGCFCAGFPYNGAFSGSTGVNGNFPGND